MVCFLESGYRRRLQRVTDEDSLPEIEQYDPYYLPFKVMKVRKLYEVFVHLFSHTMEVFHTNLLTPPPPAPAPSVLFALHRNQRASISGYG